MPPVPRACLVGTAPPRRCGIATFTDDLRAALTASFPQAPAVQVALTDVGGAYDYGPDVVFEVQAPQLSDYRTAAAFIDASHAEVLCVQHEFGIFGGPAGRHVEELLDSVSLPVVTTLHTVLAQPSPEQRAATRRVAERSDLVVVLAERAVGMLVEGCGLDPAKIRVVPHGVPALPDTDRATARESLDLTGRTVLLTFGLLGPDKGIEVVLDALPEVVADDPSLLYVVLGSTHPHVLRDSGDAYRGALEEKVRALGLEAHTRFIDRYVDIDELCAHLAASDVYITPYRGTQQIVSGTLAYAVGMGCAVVSTPYPYAEELLSDGGGALFPFGDSAALSAELRALLADDAGRAAMRERARERGRSMTWPAVSAAYAELFTEVVATHEVGARDLGGPAAVPAPSFSFLRALTDDTGVFQHAQHGVPTRAHGYCTDDVARALVACAQGADAGDPVAAELVPGYLGFLLDAQRADGRFENLLGFDRRWVEGSDSEDTLGQAVWGLGTVVATDADEGRRRLAGLLLDQALPSVGELQATKAMAYAVVGLRGYLQRFPGALAARRVARALVERLLARLDASRRDGWEWVDDAMTYANAIVPEALLRAGQALDEPAWTRKGLRLLDALLAHTWVDGRFEPPGNEGWLTRDGSRAVFGQQPIEAGLTARACVLAYEVSADERYLESARDAVAWLLGRNRLGLPLYDPTTGRCADGLDRHGVSGNTGAESTVCALLGLLALPRPVEVDLVGDHAAV